MFESDDRVERCAPSKNRRIGQRLSDGSRAIDWLVLSAVPVVLVAVLFLPKPERAALTLAYLDPTALTLFTAHYVHLSVPHLASNLLGYVVVAGTGYVLSVASGRRREFLVVFATFLLVFPFAISILNVLIERPRIGFGFSGVVMAFVGFLPITLFWYLETVLDARVDLSHSPILFFLGMAVIAVWAGPWRRLTIFVAVTCTLATGLYIRSLPTEGPGRFSPIELARIDGRREFASLGLLVFTVFLLVGFPTDPVRSGQILNLYTHLLGFSLGFLVPYSTFVLIDIGNDSSLSASLQDHEEKYGQ